MNQYIITEEERKKMLNLWSVIQQHIDWQHNACHTLDVTVQDAYNLMENVRSHPYDPTDNIDEWCKLHEEVLKDIRTEAYGSGYSDGEIIGAQSERQKVLDYLDEWVNSGDNLTLFKWELREVLREIRKING